MKKYGFIGAYDKIDMIIYVAKILNLCDKKVLVVDSTINQKARYIIPTMKQEQYYITEYESIDIAVGFKNFEQIKQYLNISGELPYDIVFIDIDNPYNIDGFGLNETDKNFFVTGFDTFSLKRGLQILSLIRSPLRLTRILFSQNATKEENDYLEYLASGYRIEWENEKILIPLIMSDYTAITENQRSAKIKFKRLSEDYKAALYTIATNIASEVGEGQIRKAIKSIERGM